MNVDQDKDRPAGAEDRGPLASRTSYEVRAKRWARGWELHVEGVGVTQSKTLVSASKMAREYVSMALDVDPESFELEMTIGGGSGPRRGGS